MTKRERIWVLSLLALVMGIGLAHDVALAGGTNVWETGRAQLSWHSHTLPLAWPPLQPLGGLPVIPPRDAGPRAEPWTTADAVLIVVLALLLMATIEDLCRRRIPNGLTAPAAVLGLLIHTLSNGWSGVWHSLSGLLVGLAVLYIFYCAGGMGAGDVKLMGAVGALLGPEHVFYAFVLTGLVGGLVAIAGIFFRRALATIPLPLGSLVKGPGHSTRWVGLFMERRAAPIPYSVAIAAGTLLSFWVLQGGFHV